MREHPNYEDVETKDLWAPLGAWKATVPGELIYLVHIHVSNVDSDDWTTHPNFVQCAEMCRDNLLVRTLHPFKSVYHIANCPTGFDEWGASTALRLV
jgi:hypothetical protein